MSVVETLLSDRKTLMAELTEAKQLITSYQIAKDNLELRVRYAEIAAWGLSNLTTPEPAQVY